MHKNIFIYVIKQKRNKNLNNLKFYINFIKAYYFIFPQKNDLGYKSRSSKLRVFVAFWDASCGTQVTVRLPRLLCFPKVW